MTDHQSDAVLKAYEILSEHFEAFVIITREVSDDDKTENSKITYHGGHSCALGLVTKSQHTLLVGYGLHSNDEEEDDE